jgi:hypothetical protein
VAEELFGAIEATGLQQLLCPNDAEGVEELGPMMF